jgi:ubiquinone/menaquinone biosynthesis C-methylase UbiE
MKPLEIRRAVTERYGRLARGGSCCGPGEAEVELGLESPLDHLALKPGEKVLDLGSGRGGEVLEVSRLVGPEGLAIGVDATPEMVWAARERAEALGASNVEYRLGEIEALPVADASVDVIISNCVINLSPDKSRVFGEARRVLRPGGRIIISDVVAAEEGVIPQGADWPSCGAGAAPVSDYRRWLEESGFTSIEISDRGSCGCGEGELRVAIVKAQKPRTRPEGRP